MTSSEVPAKVPGLHIERTSDELLVYDARTDTTHALTHLRAAVFEACNGVRSAEDVCDVVTDWVEKPVEIDLVDRAILDLTQADLCIHLERRPVPPRAAY